MFCAYLVYRYWYYNEFAAGSRSLDIWLGTINTVVLICSSLTVALGVKAAQLGKRKQLVGLLLATLVFGVAFWGSRESSGIRNTKEHHIPGHSFDVSDIIHNYPQIHIDPAHSQLYFSLYFAMTGLHALHMIVA